MASVSPYNYSTELAQLEKTGDFCDYLNITSRNKYDSNNLTEKFAVLDAMQWNQTGIFYKLFSTMVHQWIVANCSEISYLNWMNANTDVIKSWYTLLWMSVCYPYIVLPSIFSFISIICALSLVIVTVRKRIVHKLCNWMIAFEAICQVFVVFPFLVNFFSFVFNLDPVDHRICLVVLMLSTGSSYAAFMAIYIMSWERMLIVLFPMRMNSMSKSRIRLLSKISIIVCILFGMEMVVQSFNIRTVINLMYMSSLYCNTGLYSDVLNNPTSYVVISLSMLNYIVIFCTILWRHFKSNTTKTTHSSQNEGNANAKSNSISEGTWRMLRSIFIITVVLLLGWLVSSAARNQITNLVVPASLKPIVSLFWNNSDVADQIAANVSNILIGIITCLPIMASASSAPIIVLGSNDYRKAYKETYSWIYMPKNKQPNSIGPYFVKGSTLNKKGKQMTITKPTNTVT